MSFEKVAKDLADKTIAARGVGGVVKAGEYPAWAGELKELASSHYEKIGLNKKSFDVGKLLSENPALKNSLIGLGGGAGLGAIAGLLEDTFTEENDTNLATKMLNYGLLGGGLGAGAGALHGLINTPSAVEKLKADAASKPAVSSAPLTAIPPATTAATPEPAAASATPPAAAAPAASVPPAAVKAPEFTPGEDSKKMIESFAEPEDRAMLLQYYNKGTDFKPGPAGALKGDTRILEGIQDIGALGLGPTGYGTAMLAGGIAPTVVGQTARSVANAVDRFKTNRGSFTRTDYQKFLDNLKSKFNIRTTDLSGNPVHTEAVRKGLFTQALKLPGEYRRVILDRVAGSGSAMDKVKKFFADLPARFADPSKKLLDRKSGGPVIKQNMPVDQKVRSLLGYDIDPNTGQVSLKSDSLLKSYAGNNPQGAKSIATSFENLTPAKARVLLNNLLKGNIKSVRTPPTAKELRDLATRVGGRARWGLGKVPSILGATVGGAAGITSNLEDIKNVLPKFDVYAETPKSVKSVLSNQIENIASSPNTTAIQKAQLFDLQSQLPKEGVDPSDHNAWFTRILKIINPELDKRKPTTPGK
jgi:hypothetical protein